MASLTTNISKNSTQGAARRSSRFLLVIIVIVALLLLAGLSYQAIASAVDASRYPAPGQFVDAGGFKLHLNVMGEAQGGGPTVILENGGGGFTPQWAWIQPGVAQFARVVAYDRPGTGWSEASPQPLDAAGAAAALRKALQNAGISGPYVLAGHSMGALMVRTFTQLYPDEVSGVVLVDPRPLSFETVFEDGGGAFNPTFYRLLGLMNRVGIARLMGTAQTQAAGLPAGAFEQAVALSYSDHHMRGLLAEARVGESAIALLEDSADLGDRPLVVLSAGTADESFDEQARPRLTATQEEMVALSALGEHRLVDGASHYTIMTQQAYAEAVVEAIADVYADSSR